MTYLLGVGSFMIDFYAISANFSRCVCGLFHFHFGVLVYPFFKYSTLFFFQVSQYFFVVYSHTLSTIFSAFSASLLLLLGRPFLLYQLFLIVLSEPGPSIQGGKIGDSRPAQELCRSQASASKRGEGSALRRVGPAEPSRCRASLERPYCERG